MTNELTKTTDRMIDDFLASVEFEPPPQRKRLIFAIDATASRQPTWDLASNLQAQMFIEAGKYGGLDVQLVYWRGFNEMKASQYFGSAVPLVQAMTSVVCRAGHTQLLKVLDHALREHQKAPVAAMILIGDASEDCIATVMGAAVALGRVKVPVYAFLEGDDADGREAFKVIARESGGVLVPFNANSPHQLRELLGAVALLVAGGIDALTGQKPEIVRLLTHGGKR